MKTFDEIKSEFEEKNYTKKQLKSSIIGFSIIRLLFTEIATFLVSAIPFLIGYLIAQR